MKYGCLFIFAFLIMKIDDEKDAERAAKLRKEADDEMPKDEKGENLPNRMFDREASCPKCMKSFSRRDNMLRHFKNSCNGVTHDCKVCKFCALTKDELLTHMQNKHKNQRK